MTMAEVTTLTGKEEFIAQCIATGNTQEACQKMWDEGHGQKNLDKQDYGELVRSVEMQKVKISQLEAALRESTDIIKRVNTERDAVTDARKYEIALELEKDTEGRMKHGDLMKESLEELTIMKKAIDTARPKNFVSLSQAISRDEQKKKPMLTVGSWDPDTKKWKEGV
jgi:uncharacterized iron-regulated protein